MARDKHWKVWLDGKIVDPEIATLSVFTLTVLRGANVYEGLRAYWNPGSGSSTCGSSTST
jgi:branched-subunit amino acid aminotransferase/4-amino-4-deoxychorismate lyase